MKFTPRKRLATLLGVGLLGIGFTAAAVDSAVGAGENAIVVHTSSGDVSIGAEELQGAYDIANRSYTIRASDGTEDSVRLSGASIRRVLDLAGVDPASVGFLETPRSNGTSAMLGGSDLSADPPFADGPPLVFVDGSAIRYLRPVRNATDSNAADNLTTQSGSPLELTTHTGNILDVHITPEQASTGKPGSVAFKATASGEKPGEEVHFVWDFGDGTTGSGAAKTHAYDAKGDYHVVARAEGDQDSAGSSNVLTISASGKPTNPGNGSNHDGDGSGFGDGHQASGQPGGDKHTGGLKAGTSSSAGAGATDVGTPAIVPPYTGSSGIYPPTPVEPLLPNSPPPTAQPPPDKNPPTATKAPEGEIVVGKLLSAETPAPAGVASVPPEATASTAGDSPTSVWTPVGLGAGTLLLICCGAGLELRGAWGSLRMRP